jgi:D-aspartate ligase
MRIDAVVIGDGLNALGVLRSLGGRGLRLALVSRSGQGIANRSRFAHARLVLSDPTYDPAAIRGKLNLPVGGATLFLTEELDVRDCLKERENWQRQFRTYFYTPEVASVLFTKSGFDRLAREYRAPVPGTLVLRSARESAGIDRLRFPLVVKPTVRDTLFAARFEKAYRVEGQGELTDLLAQMQGTDVPLVVQEWVEGGDSDIYFNFMFIDADGELCSSFVGQKILCWPTGVGGTASCVAAPQFHEELTDMTSRFLGGIGFRGMLGLEYKRDPHSGKFYMIEPTVYRTDYQHEIATLSGCNFLYRVHASCRGERLAREDGYDRGVYWVDFPASRYSRSASPASVKAPAGVRHVDGYFRLSDPVPGFIHYGGFVASRAMSIMRRIRKLFVAQEAGSGT